MNQVAKAEKSAEANPTLMRLKELETLEKVTEKIENINLYSGVTTHPQSTYFQNILDNIENITYSAEPLQ